MIDSTRIVPAHSTNYIRDRVASALVFLLLPDILTVLMNILDLWGPFLIGVLFWTALWGISCAQL